MKRCLGIIAFLLLAIMTTVGDASAQQAWNSATLTWTTPGDDSLSGTATQFDIRYSTTPITALNFGTASRWTTGVPVPAVPGTSQSAVVTGLSPATTYWFAIETADDVPNWSGLSNVVSKTTAIAPDVVRPAALALSVSATTDSTVTLAWTATGDDSLTGTASSYDVRWSTAPITAANWGGATPVTGEPAPLAPGAAQSYVVRGLSRQTAYYFAARISDEVGNTSALSNVPLVTTPDTKPPARISDLVVGLVWFNFSSASVLPPRRGTAR